MNKKELAEMEELKTELALRLYEPIEPDLLPPDVNSREPNRPDIINGWVFNVYNMSVSKACSSSVFHGIGEWDKTSSQKPIKLYSTEKLAYKALLHALSYNYAYNLRAIQKRMENI